MTTTHNFQVYPNFFSDEKSCTISTRKKINTNPRYRYFCQTHFTAGDVEQFDTYRDKTNPQREPAHSANGNIEFQDLKNSSIKIPEIDCKLYRNLTTKSIQNTFDYIFHKFKKGIFLRIKTGKLTTFLPFSNKNFVNEWSKKICIDPRYKSLNKFIEYIQKSLGRPYNSRYVNRFVDSWYANNCLVRYEYPVPEGDSNNPIMSDMFLTLCKERKIPDMELFVNRRDFPLLKRDKTEPYNHMFDSESMPLKSHSYDNYCPILSMVTHESFADIPIPTGDDWARVTRKEGKFFPRTAQRSFLLTQVSWEERKNTAIFRGGSTGVGVTIDTNPRLKAVYLSVTTPKENGEFLLDAGITNWNLRPRKIQGEKYLQTIDVKKLPFGLSPRLSPQEQLQYKYMLHISGHSAAYRLSLELCGGWCILIVESCYKLWYQHMLEPFVHYIPVKKDLSDLLIRIRWCRNNDKKCKTIMENAQKFSEKYLSRDGILDYLQTLLIKLKTQTGVYMYNELSLDQQQFSEELKKLKKFEATFPITDHKVIFTNKLTTVVRGNSSEGPVIIKQSTSSVNYVRLIHEAFVGLRCTNKLNYCKLPNFPKIFGLKKSTEKSTEKSTVDFSLVSEYISGQTLAEYIQSKEFVMSEFMFVLVQISLALEVAQKFCYFSHNDLTPWNIILKKLPEPITYYYPIDTSPNAVYEVTTQIVPVMIDLGRSHVVYKDRHYGNVNRFSCSTIQDIVSLLVVSAYQIADTHRKHRNMRHVEIKAVIKLLNFLSGTKYRKKPFRNSGYDGFGDIRYFCKRAKKYTELINRPKFELERKTPLNLIEYIKTNFSYVFPIKKSDRLETKNIGTLIPVPGSVAVIKKCLKYKLPKNIFFAYWIVQSMHKEISQIFHKKSPFYKKFVRVMTARLCKMGEKSPIEITNKLHDIPTVFFTEKDFQLPKKIVPLYKKISDITINIGEDTGKFCTEAMLVFLYDDPFRFPDNIRDFYEKNFQKIFNRDFVINITNIVTLQHVLPVMYKRNRKYIRKYIRDTNGNTKLLEDYTC